MTSPEEIQNYRERLAEKGFREIRGYKKYWIDLAGTVISTRRKNPIIKKQYVDQDGYLAVGLISSGVNSSRVAIHRALMLAFKYKEGCEKLTVDHVNGKKQDNRLGNLRWCTASENCKFKAEQGQHRSARSVKTKLTEQDVINIRKEYRWDGYKKSNVYELSKKYGIGPSGIQCIISRKTWKYL